MAVPSLAAAVANLDAAKLARRDARLAQAVAVEAILAARGVPQLLLPVMLSMLDVVDGVVRIDSACRTERGLPPATVADLVAELRASPIYGRAFTDLYVPAGTTVQP